MKLAAKPLPRKNETRDLTRPIIAQLNVIDGVRVTRNVDRGLMTPYKLRLNADAPRIMTGLGKGGSDIVGCVSVRVISIAGTSMVTIGRLFCLEVKRHAVRKAHPETRADQERWRAAVKRLGGFAGLIEAHSTEDGVEQAF